MRAKRWGAYGLAMLALPGIGKAQIPLLDTPKSEKGETTQAPITGKSSFDLVRMREGAMSIPLRFGNVIERSETVVLAGRTLQRERDYSVDYPSGVVYLKVQYRDGQTVNVSYRYDDTKKTDGVYGSVGGSTQNAFAFELAPGTRAMMGMGYTERMSDGTVLSGNLFGIASSMNFAGGSLQGLMMVNDRQKSDTASLMGDEGPQQELEEGTGKAIVQNYSTGALGGKLSLSYQDIDDRFAGFSAFAGAGFTADQIKMFEGEKGLKRSGFNLSGAKIGKMNFGGGLQSVGDSNGMINWRTASASLAGVSLDWSSQVVDPGFNKFNGLREQDRQQLQKERGLERQNLGLGYKGGSTESKFDMLSVRGTEDEQGLWRSSLSIASGWLNASWARQSVDEGFTRFGDLREGDRGQLAKERGIDRNTYSMGIASNWLKANYNSTSMMDSAGEMRGTNFDLGYGGWSFSHITRKMDETFGSQNAMTDGDKNGFIGDVAKMYDPNAKPNGRDMGGLNSTGIDRTGMRIAGGFGDYKTFWNQVEIDNESGMIRLNEFSVSKGKTNFTFSEQTSNGFQGNRDLLWTEQQKLGTIDGMNKTDIGLDTTLGKNGVLKFNMMRADQPNGGAFRQRLDLSVAGINFSYARRGVDQSFTDVGQLVDPERGLLQSLIGFDQSEMVASYKPNDAMSFGYRQANAINSLYDEMRGYRQFTASMQLSPMTLLAYESTSETVAKEGLSTIDSQYTSMSVHQDMGNAGKVMVRQEQQKFSGVDQDLPDAQKQTVSYEKQLTKNTTFRTEQSETKFDDGTRTTESKNKLSTKLSDRFGVSVEDQQVRRDGDQRDELRRNYGIWVDFGSGIRLDYGYNRNALSETEGTMNTNVGLSGGKFAGLDFGGASYKTNRWDSQHQNYFGNVSLKNQNPFAFGGVTDINFFYRTDTQRDFLAWQKELIDMGFSGAIGNVGFGWTYSSQVNKADGVRAIDRAFLLTTDKTGKAQFQASLKYGIRTMPDDESMFIRDYGLSYRANKFLTIEHKMLTNPLKERGGILLGSAPLDERTSSWSAKYQNDAKLKFDFSWNEIKRDNLRDALRREARFNATLFADQPSPVQLTYSLQQFLRNGDMSLAHTYGISYTQRPGPNQALSFSLEHLQWGQGRPENNPFLRDWKMRFDYSVRF